ncbi:MAG: ABC transporter ATP-binding protein [Oscillospiraceae bacterium]|jgi:putative ABC transport system ATP-binding protein|nr:ABC transporter ATP-binding protein [Oscillospiraceae bacterium]
MNTLALQNVSYKYEGGKKTIFENVNLTFDKGKIYTIVGKSGVGKSSLLNLLAGLDIATEGTITFENENLALMNLNRYRARKAGIIFQGLNLLTNVTAIDNIILSMNISNVSERDKKSKAFSLLEKVGISKEKAIRKVLKLSGGEQQRVAIARALAHAPDLIVADEPTGNLDKKTEDYILKILTRLAHEDGKCVVIVTHSKKVTSIADEVWELDKGMFRQISSNKK